MAVYERGSGRSLPGSKLEYLHRAVEEFWDSHYQHRAEQNIARDFPSCGHRLLALETIEKLIL